MIEAAYAMGAGGQTGQGGGPSILFLWVIIFVIFYFLLIRPQQKQNKERRQMIENLKKGDRVITNGGIYGRIVDIKGDVVDLEIADRVKIKVSRHQIGGLATPEAAEPPAAQKEQKTDKKSQKEK
ncbi:MAG: preprotein translocase subunit YajC [Desulfatibacillaceae bacterium]